ncbi:hypothetical protein B0T24DRAFT_598219 [Lasiosphaeria ovina]|uniref:Uncharacterized protein n=1 Tax=Lasiosphaeria ovina TaxID=92902 RepID=A0AAE0JV45_9PEZI|nr:hypothetical protein B0T24DRAFT_598219 [Lasiosphaeria ovina]
MYEKTRPPQRKLSNPSLSQRPPAHQRALSQQYLPPSPIRKETTFHDLGPPDPADAAQQSRFPSQRRGGSRLKLELSHDTPDSVITQIAFSESPNAIESSKPATPSRKAPCRRISQWLSFRGGGRGRRVGQYWSVIAAAIDVIRENKALMESITAKATAETTTENEDASSRRSSMADDSDGLSNHGNRASQPIDIPPYLPGA